MSNIILFSTLYVCLLLTSNLRADSFLVETVAELHATADNAAPGDSIVMLNGIWMDAEITFDANGAPGNPVVLSAETPGGVIITGRSRLRIGGDYLVVTGLTFENCVSAESNLISFRRTSSDLASYSRLTETVIIDCNPADPTEDYKWVGIFGDHNEVDHCYIANKTHKGATLVVWSQETEGFHHIHHNLFGPRPLGNGNGFETIRVGDSGHAQFRGSNLVEHNYFYQTDGEIEIISGKSSYSTYRYNIFRDCNGGLTLRHGTDCVVEGNLFFGEGKAGSYGVRIIDRGHKVINNYFQGLNGTGDLRYPISIMNADAEPEPFGYQHAINETVAFNTIVDCTRGIMVGAEGRPIAPDNCVLVNNVVITDGFPPVVHNNPPTNTSYDGNFFYREDGGVSVPSDGFVDVDPELMLALGDSIFRPSASSPVIGAAVTGWVTNAVDFELQPRSLSPAAGADEPSTALTIDRGVFGPTWRQSDGTLPVDLLGFEVDRQGKCVELSWRVAHELSLDKYVIMRSINGRDFIPVGQKNATGYDNGWQDYAFLDCNLQEVNTTDIFYQLQMLDLDGTTRWSKILVQEWAPDKNRIVFSSDRNGRQLTLFYPLSDGEETSASYSVYAIDGRKVIGEQSISTGERLNLGIDFPPGVYIINCLYVDGSNEVFKWIKR